MISPSTSLQAGRRSFVRKLLSLSAPAMLLGGGSAYGYSSLVERHRLVVERHDLTLSLGPKAPPKFRMVTLSDFHFDPLHESEFVAECVRRTNELKPDLVLLTGDYFSSSSRRVAEFAALLGALQASAGVYACLGNHDHWNQPWLIRGGLEKHGIGVLVNQHSRVPCAGGEVVLAGLQSAWAGKPDMEKACRGLKRGERAIGLVHEPDYADLLAEDSRFVFQAAGHTHGGQVRLPGIGALKLPSWGKEYDAGFYKVKDLTLYVNRGVGTIEYHVRFLCPPEIACFDVVNLG